MPNRLSHIVLGGQRPPERLLPAQFFNYGLEFIRHLSLMIATNGTGVKCGSSRRSAVLMNVGRGPVVDEVALIRVLTQPAIKGAALDVFERANLCQTDTRITDSITCSCHRRLPTERQNGSIAP